VARTVELMKQGGDVRKAGGIDLPTLQKYLNLWFSLSEDLFGGEISSNAADFFAAGLKGRYKEAQYTDHKVLEGTYKMAVPENGTLVEKEIPMRTAMNEVLRDNYVEDCQRAVDKWNRTIERAGLSERLALPHRRFHRNQGIYAGLTFDPAGNPISAETWAKRRDEWLPNAADEAFVETLMHACTTPGKISSWVAPPSKGINGQSFEFEYVRS
jgi:benzoyl-CoA 2,3-epoxidase subunit B